MRPEGQGVLRHGLVQYVEFIFLRLLEGEISVPVPFRVFHQDWMSNRVRQMDEIFACGSQCQGGVTGPVPGSRDELAMVSQ